MKKAFCMFLVLAVAMIALSQAAGAGDIKAFAGKGLKGKVSGQQLILIDPRGNQVQAPDGVYTANGGKKITVQKGRIIDINHLSPALKKSAFGIIDVDF